MRVGVVVAVLGAAVELVLAPLALQPRPLAQVFEAHHTGDTVDQLKGRLKKDSELKILNTTW